MTCEITETSRGSLKGESLIFNELILHGTPESLREQLIERYGKFPRGHKIYIDTPTGAIHCGFTHSYWNRDISHDSKSWFQTDWITFSERTPVNIKRIFP